MKKKNEYLNDGVLDPQLAAEQEEIKSRKFKYGTLATIFTLLFIIAVIVINIFVGYMTDRYVLEIDMTKERLFEISEDTKEVIADLSEPITITVLANETTYKDSTELLSNIYETLQRYEALAGGMITVRYINPNTNPKFIEQYNTLGDLAANDIIVESSKRFKKLAPTSLYSYETDDTGVTYYIGLRAEQKLTSALLFVTSDVINKAAYVRGHNEDYFMDELDALLTTANYEVTSIITAREEIPEDVTLLIVSSPTVDYSPEEIAKIEAFLQRGGDMVVSMTPNVVEPLDNLNLFFEEWGVRYTDQLIFDSQQSLSSYPMYVVPNIATYEGITDNLNTKNQFAMIPGALSIEQTGTQTASVTVTPLMISSSTSYAKNIENLSLTYDREEGDVDGPFNMMVLSERVESDKNLNYTRSDILFCNAGMITDSILAASEFLNATYLTTALNYVSEYTDAVIIPDKDFESTTLTILAWQANLVFWIVVIGIPLVFILLGIFVWARRRHL